MPTDEGFVMGAAFLGMGGSCFLPKGSRAGLALCSPCPLCSSMSGLCCSNIGQMRGITMQTHKNCLAKEEKATTKQMKKINK